MILWGIVILWGLNRCIRGEFEVEGPIRKRRYEAKERNSRSKVRSEKEGMKRKNACTVMFLIAIGNLSSRGSVREEKSQQCQ